MYMYTWQEEPTRVARNELALVEVRHRISILTSLEPEKVPMEVVVEPFHVGNPSCDVSYS